MRFLIVPNTASKISDDKMIKTVLLIKTKEGVTYADGCTLFLTQK